MKFAIPMADGKLCMHFGHCETFALIVVDEERKLVSEESVDPPPHQPGLLPPWLAERGVTHVIAGGMGQRAQQLFRSAGIDVLVGAPAKEAAELVRDYLAGTLSTGENLCDH